MLHFELEEYLWHLAELVNIDSFSRDPAGTERIGDYLKRLYDNLGWYVERRQVDANVGPVLIITNDPGAKHYDVMLSGHMDTVFPTGTVKSRPFTMDDNEAYGPGVSDMKDGLLAAYYAVKELQEQDELKDLSIVIVHNPDEEISSRYSRPIIEEYAKKSSYCLVLESARLNGNLVNARKGVGKFVVEFYGKSAHAATHPEEGANALEEFILTAPEIMKWGDCQKGTSVNIGIVTGGTTSNSIPDYTRTEIDVRINSEEEGKRIEGLFADLPRKTHIDGVTIKVSGQIYRPPMPFTEDTKKLCKAVDKIIEHLGINAGWEFSAGGSDGNFAAALGIPTIDGLGPVGGHGHSEDENLVLDSIMERIELLYEVIKYCGQNKR